MFVGCFPIIHVVVGILLITDSFPDQRPHELDSVAGWIFVAVGGMVTFGAWLLGAAVIVAGRNLAAHKAYTYCLVIAGIECMFMPFGTALGVYTIVTLNQPSVRNLFQGHRTAPPLPRTRI